MSDYEAAMYKFERLLLIGAFVAAKGNICKAARNTGHHRNTMNRKVKEFQLAGILADIKQGKYAPQRDEGA